MRVGRETAGVFVGVFVFLSVGAVESEFVPFAGICLRTGLMRSLPPCPVLSVTALNCKLSMRIV